MAWHPFIYAKEVGYAPFSNLSSVIPFDFIPRTRKMTFLEEFRRKKNTLKSGVLSLVHRARGNSQDTYETVNFPPGRPIQVRPSSPDMSDWDSNEEHLQGARRSRTGFKKSTQLRNPQTARTVVEESRVVLQECHGTDRWTLTDHKTLAEERKKSLEAVPSTSGIRQKWKSESEHLQVGGNESGNPTITGKRQLSTTQQTYPRENEQKRREDNLADRDMYRGPVIKPPDTTRPKHNYRRCRPPKTPPLKPQHPLRAAGFVTSKYCSEDGIQKSGKRRPSEPNMDILLGLDGDISEFTVSGRTGVSSHGAGETTREDKMKPVIIGGYGRDDASTSTVMECCSSDEEPVFSKSADKGDAASRLFTLRGESSRSISTVSPQAGSDGDPLDGLEELLCEVEQMEREMEKRRSASRVAEASRCRSDSGLSWASLASSTDVSHCDTGRGGWGLTDRMKTQRAARKRELEVMNQLLEEIGGAL